MAGFIQSDTTLGAIRPTGRSAQEQSSFFQAWLFFDILAEVLGITTAAQDFVVDGFVTMKRLHHFTSAYYRNLPQNAG